MKKSMYDPYTDWILEHYKDYHNCPELIKVLKDDFGLDKANEASIKFWFSKRFGMTTVYGRHDFSEEEKEFIKKYYPDNGAEKTVEMLKEIFNTDRTVNSVKTLANGKLGLKVRGSFKQQLIDSSVEKMKASHTKDIGSIRPSTKKNGHIDYKIKADDNQWKAAGVVIWEKTYGPIPKGYRIVYLDGDNSNLSLDNLYLAPYKLAYQVVTNKSYQSNNEEITKSLIKYYELRNALGINWEQWNAIQRRMERKENG